MIGEVRFDIFLSYNTADKSIVRRLKRALEKRGLRVWMDESQLVPGVPWQELLESGILSSDAVAVLVGRDGVGPWEDRELRAAIEEAVRRQLPVIPVLLPGITEKPRLPLFLRGHTWVDLRRGLRKEAIDRLLWGVAGRKLEGGRQRPALPAPVESKPALRVVASDIGSLSHQTLLDDLTRFVTVGRLRASRIAPILLATLSGEERLELDDAYDPSLIIAGVLASDEYFARVWHGAGERDWQRDVAPLIVPALVGVTRSLKRSPAAQALTAKLCDALAAQLRLTLVWPKEADEFNDQVNAIYKACLKATHMEDDAVLLQLKGLTVVGPA
jgi:hypothetical protein